MAIRIVEGVPGSGKTYYVVHHVMTEYFFWDSVSDKWVSKDDSLRVIHNVEGLVFGESLEELVELAGGVSVFFSIEYQERVLPGRVVYVIDEGQFYFGIKFFDPVVFLFFQKHRHYGKDFYLIVQDEEHLSRGLRSLAEYHIKAVRRSLSFFGEFRYRFYDGIDEREVWQTKTLKRDSRYSCLYRSFLAVEKEKIGSVPRRFLIWFLLLLVLAFAGYKFFLSYRFGNVMAGKKGGASVKGVADNVRGRGSVEVFSLGGVPAWVSDGFVRVSGVFGVQGDRVFLVERDGETFRWLEYEMVRSCRCPVDMMRVGDRVQVWLAGEASQAPREREASKAKPEIGLSKPLGRKSVER